MCLSIRDFLIGFEKAVSGEEFSPRENRHHSLLAMNLLPLFTCSRSGHGLKNCILRISQTIALMHHITVQPQPERFA